MVRRLMVAGALAATAACSMITDLWTGGPKELPRVREDAVSMSCDAGRTLVVRIEPEGKAAWIILPEREFRLDRVADSADTRYSNGRTTLVVKDDRVSVDESGAPGYSNCRRANS